MRKEVTYCDICGAEGKIIEEQIQTIFTTEQTEGRSCKPYLDGHKFDICENCLQKVLSGNYLWGSGAQGHNKYIFNPNKDLVKLQHHYDSTIGLWATDRPELITPTRKESYHMFEIQ